MSINKEKNKFNFSKKRFLNNNNFNTSKFSLGVCLFIVFSCCISFLSGFFLSSFTFKENYSSVYEGLLNEIDEARSCVAREKSNLQRLTLLHAKALKEHNPLISADFNEDICYELNELSNNTKIDTSKNLKNFINKICTK